MVSAVSHDAEARGAGQRDARTGAGKGGDGVPAGPTREGERETSPLWCLTETTLCYTSLAVDTAPPLTTMRSGAPARRQRAALAAGRPGTFLPGRVAGFESEMLKTRVAYDYLRPPTGRWGLPVRRRL